MPQISNLNNALGRGGRWVRTFLASLGITLLLAGCTMDNTSDDTPDPGKPPTPGTPGAILYNWPVEATPSTAYTVKVNGTPYFVFPVPQGYQRPDGLEQPFNPHIVTFDIQGAVQVDITPRALVNTVKIRPEHAGITYKLVGNTITVVLEKPQFLSIELNDDIENPLLLFANEPETEIPDKNDPNVKFYEAGKIYNVGYVLGEQPVISSNQTVYIAPGAIVYGAFSTPNRPGNANMRIMGRGVLSGAKFLEEHGGNSPIFLNSVDGVTIEGIIVVDNKNWSIPLMSCNNVNIKGIKIVSNTGYEDGIDIVGSKNVTIDNCFIRTKDDCISPKSNVNYFTGASGAGNVENVMIKNTIIWNGKYGNGVRFGGELDADYVRNVTFENIDMIHTENPGAMTDEGSFAIHNDGRATIEDITCRNIRIEDPQKMLFDFSVVSPSTVTPNAPRGKIRNVRMEDITVTTHRGSMYSTIKCASATANVSNITFRNLVIDGKKIMTKEDLNMNINEYAKNIKFE